jgi:hypothetical protein
MAISFQQFPNSQREPFTKTSDFDTSYNCIAWAAEDSSRWYEPDPVGIFFWPVGIPRNYSIKAYIALYQYLGYECCDDGEFEAGYEKVAIFSVDNVTASHASRQLNVSSWTSKLGKDMDVSHSIFSISGGYYGNVVQFLKRQANR